MENVFLKKINAIWNIDIWEGSKVERHFQLKFSSWVTPWGCSLSGHLRSIVTHWTKNKTNYWSCDYLNWSQIEFIQEFYLVIHSEEDLEMGIRLFEIWLFPPGCTNKSNTYQAVEIRATNIVTEPNHEICSSMQLLLLIWYCDAIYCII